MDIRSMQKNREQHMRVLNSLLSFYDGLEGLTEGTLYYIERCIAQVVENQFQIYISMGRQKEIQRELREWGSWIKRTLSGNLCCNQKEKHNDAQKNWISDSSDRSNGVSDF